MEALWPAEIHHTVPSVVSLNLSSVVAGWYVSRSDRQIDYILHFMNLSFKLTTEPDVKQMSVTGKILD